MYGEFEKAIRVTKTSVAGLAQDIVVRAVDGRVTVNSAAMAAATAFKIRDKASLNGVNPGRITHSMVKQVDMAMAYITAIA